MAKLTSSRSSVTYKTRHTISYDELSDQKPGSVFATLDDDGSIGQFRFLVLSDGTVIQDEGDGHVVRLSSVFDSRQFVRTDDVVTLTFSN